MAGCVCGWVGLLPQQFFHGYIQKQVHVILSGYIIWHFYCTLSKGLLFPGYSVVCTSENCFVEISLNSPAAKRRSLSIGVK